MGQRPMVLLFFGVVLFLCKQILFYLFQSNLYKQFTLGNKTARLCIGLFAVLGIILLLKQLGKHISNQIPVRFSQDQVKGLLVRFLEFIKSTAKTVVTTITSLVTGPALIVIICIAALLAMGGLVAGIQIAKRTYDDILDIVEPLLQTIASTGKNRVTPSTAFHCTQTLSLLTVCFYTVSIESNMKKRMNTTIEKEIRMLTDAIRPVSLSEEKFQKARKKLVNSSFDEKLRIGASKAFIADVVENC